MSVKDDLIAAKALIADPSRWRQDPDRTFLHSSCAVVAVERITGKRWTDDPTAYDALDRALPADWRKAHGPRSVGTFNDQHTHAEVMALFDRAIKAQP